MKFLYKSYSHPEKEMLQVRKFNIVKCDPLSKKLALLAISKFIQIIFQLNFRGA